MAEFNGIKVGTTGFGLLGFTWRGKSVDDEQAFACLRAALAAGANYWNGSGFYGTPSENSLTLLSRYFTRYPEDASRVALNIKGGATPNLQPDCRPEALTAEVERSLAQLGPHACAIAHFEPARRDPAVPLADSLHALAALAAQGRIGGVALSEVGAGTIREAAAVTRIAAVEVELSLWAREPLSNGVAAACAELGIPLVAYSPLGRGALTGAIAGVDDLPAGDVRRMLPRFAPENLPVNLRLVREVQRFAAEKGCTAGQLALGWVRGLSRRPGMPVIIPIPGSTKVERVAENSTEVELSDAEMARIDAVLEKFEVVGERYHAEGMKWVNG